MGGDLRLYDVTVGNHKTQMRLNDDDATAMGDDAVLAGAEPQVPTRPPQHRDPVVSKSRPVTSNKMRGTEHGATSEFHAESE